jgi:hypothetical protein
MITIRSPKSISKPTLIGFEATLTTPRAVYELSSTDPVDDGMPIAGGLYGRIMCPHGLFRFGPDYVLEQHMFVSCDSSDAAVAWKLRGKPLPARLIVRPHFGGCGRRGYRDRGFRRDSQENGGRLCWLPHVLGPKIVADTNGQYYDEPVRSPEGLADCNHDSPSLVVPGTFEFDLSHHPSILILSTDGGADRLHVHKVGMFLAGLLGNTQRDRTSEEQKALWVCATTGNGG